MNNNFQIYVRSKEPICIFDIKREINITTHIGIGENTNVKGNHGIIEVINENDVTSLIQCLQYNNSKTYIRHIPIEEMKNYAKVLFKEMNAAITNTQLYHRLTQFGKIIDVEEIHERKYVLCSRDIANEMINQKEELRKELSDESMSELFDIKIEDIGYELLIELPSKCENKQELFEYLEEQLDNTGCDHTLHHTERWLKNNISQDMLLSMHSQADG